MLVPNDDYHSTELRIAFDPRHERHNLPVIPAGARVLDVGCGAGQTLIAACPHRVPSQVLESLERIGHNCVGCVADCPDHAWAFGVDNDLDALRLGAAWSDRIQLACASSESLPFRSQSFDLVISRVSIMYMDVRKALAEMRRVLRPGGALWLSGMHYRAACSDAMKATWKSKARFGYVLANSMLFHLLQRQFRLFEGTETFQTERGMKRALEYAGFAEVVMKKQGVFFEVTARVPARDFSFEPDRRAAQA